MKTFLRLLVACLTCCALSGATITVRGPFAAPVQGGGGGGATVAFVDFALSAGSSSTTTQAITKTLTAGRFIVIGVGWEDSTATATVADNLGNTYTPLTREASAGGNAYTQLFSSPTTNSGAATITITWNAAVFFTKAIAWEFTGATVLDGQNIGTGTGTSAVLSGDVTTVQASEGLCAVVKHYDAVTVSPQASWTEDEEDPSYAVEFQHRVVSSTGTYHSAATLTGNGTWSTSFGAFK